VDASNPGNEDPSLFTIIINLQKGKKAAQAEAVVNREIQRLFREPISDREMERAQNRLSFDFYSGLATSYEKARFLGYFEATANDFRKGIEFRKEVAKVTPAEVHEVVKKYFVPDNRTIITALPKTVAKTK
jgi:predicted Zn-dependent peptidase